MAQCPALFFPEALTARCYPCNDQCSGGCSGPLATQCQSCQIAQLGSTCLPFCPAGTYLEQTTRLCKPCNVQCRDTCSGPSSRNCDACLNFNNTLTSQCVSQCPATTFADELNQCFACNRECLTGCYGAGPDQCSVTCTSGGCLPACKHAVQMTANGRVCVAQCPNSSYLDAFSQCQLCDSLCDRCTAAGPTACVSCTAYSYQNICYSSCPVGTYAPTNSMTCQPCNTECVAGCVGPLATDCGACVHVNNSGTCQYSCPILTYLQGNNCLSCNAECAVGCIGPDASQCVNTACRHFTLGSTCVQQCPRGTLAVQTICRQCPFGNYFLNDTGDCALCNVECTGGCSGPQPNQCLGPCKHLALAMSGTSNCVSQCPAMYFAGVNQQCQQCSDLCSGGCTDPTAFGCFSCMYHKYQSECTSTCPFGTHGSNGIICSSCNSECLGCTADGPLRCLTCRNALDPVLGCVSSCAPNKFTLVSANATQCVDCLSVPGMALDLNVCRVGCPTGKYVDSMGLCKPCDSQCLSGGSCEGPGPSNCSSCQSASLNGTCVAACPIGTYINSQKTCLPCDTSCVASAGCVGPSDSDCLQCAHYRYPVSAPLGPACRSGQVCARCVTNCPGVLTAGTCALTCGTFEYISANRTCLPCDPQCSTGCVAGGPSACLDGVCRGNKLASGECVQSCPAFQVSINNLCQPCDGQCLLGCTGLGPSNCLNKSCVAGYSNGVCVPQCPAGQYWQGVSGWQCTG